MTDQLLSSADQEEALSLVYAKAVAAHAGYVTAKRDYDRDGVDLQIVAGGQMRPALDVQLKATSTLSESGDSVVRFPLKVGNYDLLREPTMIPRLLILLDLPNDSDRWVTITDDELVLRHRAYWLNLRDAEETLNRWTVTVSIPRENLFTVESLRDLMDQSRQGRVG